MRQLPAVLIHEHRPFTGERAPFTGILRLQTSVLNSVD